MQKWLQRQDSNLEMGFPARLTAECLAIRLHWNDGESLRFGRRKSPTQVGCQRAERLFAESRSWGGKDRTCEWRSQRPLPYHLATPQ